MSHMRPELLSVFRHGFFEGFRLVSRSDETMSHLGAFVPQAGSFDARICGTWEGTTSEELGGYLQTIEFETDCLNAKITVMGQILGITSLGMGDSMGIFNQCVTESIRISI